MTTTRITSDILSSSTDATDAAPAASVAEAAPAVRSVLVTGAAGAIGRLVVRRLAEDRRGLETIVAADIRALEGAPDGVIVAGDADVRDGTRLDALFAEHRPDAVVHLAAIVTPSPGQDRELARSVDVDGTRRVLDACIAHGVKQVIVTSSGAAYGYHADNRAWLDESDPLRAGPDFAYAYHKRLVEEMLAQERQRHPELRQLVLRPGTILGKGTRNLITNLFEKRLVVGMRGSATPFCLIWDEDVARCIADAVHGRHEGVYNLTADGEVTLRDIAAAVGRPFVRVPPTLVRAGISVLRKVGLTRYGPEQTGFIRYRPVLRNDRIKAELGFEPRMNARQVLDHWIRHREPDGESRRKRGRAPSAPFRGKVVVVSGAAGGIGRALANRFADDGAKVALLDRDAPAAERAADDLKRRGIDAIAIACDVADETSCRAAIAAVERTYGGVDVLLANAGITHLSAFAETDMAVLRRVMNVNFFGAAHLASAALPSLTARRGRIAVTSSLAGFSPLLGRTAYAASKHALHGLFESLRSEVEPHGVSVLLVCPGFTDTNIGKNAVDGSGAPVDRPRGALGRPMPPSELADAVHGAVAARRRLLVTTALGHASWWVSRLAPALYERVMASTQRKATGLAPTPAGS